MLRVGALRAHRVLRLRKKQCGQVLVPSTAGFSWGAVFVPAGLAVRLQHSFTPALRKSLGSQQHKELTSPRSVPCQSCHTVLGQALSLPLHFCTVWRCQRVVWDQVRSPGSSLRGQSPSCWQGNPAGRSAPSWLPFCVRTPAGSALLVSLPIPWGIFVPQGEGAGRQVTSARHLQGFEARPPEQNWRHDPLSWAWWMSSEPHRNPLPWSSVFLCLENPAVLTQSCTTSPTGRSPACR